MRCLERKLRLLLASVSRLCHAPDALSILEQRSVSRSLMSYVAYAIFELSLSSCTNAEIGNTLSILTVLVQTFQRKPVDTFGWQKLTGFQLVRELARVCVS